MNLYGYETRYEMSDVIAIESVPTSESDILDDDPHVFVFFWDGAVYCSHQNVNLRTTYAVMQTTINLN